MENLTTLDRGDANISPNWHRKAGTRECVSLRSNGENNDSENDLRYTGRQGGTSWEKEKCEGGEPEGNRSDMDKR